MHLKTDNYFLDLRPLKKDSDVITYIIMRSSDKIVCCALQIDPIIDLQCLQSCILPPPPPFPLTYPLSGVHAVILNIGVARVWSLIAGVQVDGTRKRSTVLVKPN